MKKRRGCVWAAFWVDSDANNACEEEEVTPDEIKKEILSCGDAQESVN